MIILGIWLYAAGSRRMHMFLGWMRIDVHELQCIPRARLQSAHQSPTWHDEESERKVALPMGGLHPGSDHANEFIIAYATFAYRRRLAFETLRTADASGNAGHAKVSL